MTRIDLITPEEYEELRETARASIAARQCAARDTDDGDDEEEDDGGPAWDSE